MNNEVVTVIIRAVVAILSVVITTVIVPYIKGKMGEAKFKELEGYIEYAVRCAEQVYTPEQWKEKKEYVSAYIIRKARELNIELSSEDIDILIEGIVNLVKHGEE